jgi:hypothetical protein
MPVPSGWDDISETPSANSPLGSETVGPNANDYFQAAFAFIKQLYQGAGEPTTSQDANNQTIINLAPGINPTDAVNMTQLNTVLGAPSGTRVVFQQAAAPTGWTIDSSAGLTDCSMRFNQAVTSGGITTWSAWNYGGQFNINAHVLTVAEMPSHAHGDAGHAHNIADGGHSHGIGDPGHNHPNGIYSRLLRPPYGGSLTGADSIGSGSEQAVGNGDSADIAASGTGIWTGGSGTGIGIYAGYAQIQANGGNAGHIHTLTTPQVKYADCVVCIKS